MQISRNLIRLALDLSKGPGATVYNVVTGQPATAYVGTDIEIDITLFLSVANSTVVDVSDLNYIQIDLKTPGGLLNASQLTLTQSSLDNTTTAANWAAGTNEHAQFLLTNSQTNFALSTNAVYTLVVSGVTNDSPGRILVYGEIPITFIPTGIGAGGSPSPTVPTFYTTSQSDARYVQISGLLSLLGATAQPTISLQGSPGSQTISLASTSGGASIYYTTNGSTPTTGSTLYTTPFAWNSAGTVKAIAATTLLGTSSVSGMTTGLVYFGCSSSQPLNGTQIAALATSQQQSTLAGNYSFTPSGAQYFYFFFPNVLGFPNATPAGFNIGGFPLSLAGSAAGFTSSSNGWSYLPITVNGVSGNLFCSNQQQTLSGTVVVS